MGNNPKITVNIVPANSFGDVKAEKNFSCLNKKGFVRTLSATEQWILLVNDAWAYTGFPENELVRDYLSLMLERYMTRADLYQTLSDFNYVQHLLRGDNIDPDCMQEVADISLQYVSFVPGRSVNRHQPRSLKYSHQFGEGLYGNLSDKMEGKDDWFSKAYREMSNHFGLAAIILRSIRSPLQGIRMTDSSIAIPSAAEAKEMADRYLLYTS